MNQTHSELIVGYLKKTLSEDELKEFYEWVNKDQKNKQLFFEAKIIYDASLTKDKYTDVSDSWQRLINKRTEKKQTKAYSLWRHLSKYAAVAAITIIATSAFFLFNDTLHKQPVAQYVGGDGITADMIILPDGTRVSVGTKTTFHYANDYGRNSRIVYLEGEAFFDVARIKNKPFIVKTKAQDIEALGTKFNVMAYPTDSIFATTLLEGSISLKTDSLNELSILKPNQQFVYNRNRHIAEINEVEASCFISWIDGYYYFPDQKLEEILTRLSTIYGVEFDIKSEGLKNKRFTGTFYRGQTVKNILEVINLSIPIKYKINEKQITISG